MNQIRARQFDSSAMMNHAYSSITLRRAQILRGLTEARTEREIASLLCLSVHSVRSHVEDLKTITGQSSTRELSRWWTANRLSWHKFYGDEAGI